MAVAAAFCEALKCSSEIFGKILFSMRFILDNWSPVCVLPKCGDVNEASLWTEGYSSLLGQGFWKSGKEFNADFNAASLYYP